MVGSTRNNDYDETPVGGAAGRRDPHHPRTEVPRPLKLSEFVDPKEEKAYAALCAQLAFKPERGEAAIAFKLRAQAKLASIPEELHLSVLVRCVSETDAGTKWLHGLRTQACYPITVADFWEQFEHEFLPLDPKSTAYTRLFAVRQEPYMSASAYVDKFRDNVSSLYALGAAPFTDEALAHYFLFRASSELRHAVRLQMVGQKYTLAAVFEKAIHVGAESRRPSARVNAVSMPKKGGPACYNCGHKDHKFTDCPKPLKPDLEKKKAEGEKPKGSPK